jgi:hypothetical protein
MSVTAQSIVNIAQSLRGGSSSSEATAASPEVSSFPEVRAVDPDNDEYSVTSSQSEETSFSLTDGSEGDTSADQETGAADPTAKSPAPSGKESIVVTDDKGKRRIEVDFNNKDQIKKYVQLAHGARKWQAERDQALNKAKEVESQYIALRGNWDVLEQTYQSSGIEGLVDLLEGKQGAFQEWEKSRLDRHEMLKKASPAERELFEARENELKRQREIEKIRKENEDFKTKVMQEKETAELRSLESTVHPVFDRYRFADKLGDSDTEQMFDEMLWNAALKRLEPYEEKGLPITADLVEREFKSVSTALRKRINLQAEKKAAKAVEQKKREATENVQAAVSNGYRSSSAAKEAEDLIKSGNIAGLFKGWGKYGKVFNK